MQSTTNFSPFASHSGPNFADLNALLKLQPGNLRSSNYFQEAVRDLYLHYRDMEKQTWRELILAGEQVARFHSGQQLITPSPFLPGRWLPYNVQSPSEGERRALSIMQWHFTTCIEKWLTSSPDVRFRAGVQSDEAAESAEAAKLISRHYATKFYGVEQSIQEALSGLCYGTYIWRLKVDNQQTITAFREIFEDKEVSLGEGWGKCGDCGYAGIASDFPDERCKDCGGMAQVEPPATQLVPTSTGREPVQLGDFVNELIPFPAVRFDLHTTADQSEWMIIERRTTATTVRQSLGNFTIPGQPSSNLGLDVIDRLASSGQAQGGKSGVGGQRQMYKDPVSVEEFWCSSNQYGDIKLNREIKTVGGETIPADTRLGDVFNGNLCFLGLNEMSTVLGVFPEDHRDYMTQGVWYSRQGSGVGRGQQDLVEIQKRLNADDQLVHNFWRATSTPSLLVLSEVLGEEGKGQYLGWGAENIPVSKASLPEGMSLKDVVTPAFVPQSVSGQMFEYVYRRLEEYAQKASHAMNMTSGIPGVNNETATGANITQALQAGLYLPPLSIKGENRLRTYQKLLKLYPKQFPVDRYFPLGGKFNQHAGKYLNGADLCMDIVGEVVPESQNPRNSYMKRQDYVAFSALLANLSAVMIGTKPYLTPDRIDDIERTFDLENESESKNVAADISFRRVRRMQEMAGMAADPMQLIAQLEPPVIEPGVDPATGQPTVEPTIDFICEPAHEVKAQWLSEWLDSNEAEVAPRVLRLAVAQLSKLHIQAGTMQQSAVAFSQGSVQAAAQAPMAMGEAQLQQGQEQPPQPDPNQAMKLEADERKQEAEAEEAEKQRAHEKEMADVTHKHKVAEIRAKPKPAKKAAK